MPKAPSKIRSLLLLPLLAALAGPGLAGDPWVGFADVPLLFRPAEMATESALEAATEEVLVRSAPTPDAAVVARLPASPPGEWATPPFALDSAETDYELHSAHVHLLHGGPDVPEPPVDPAALEAHRMVFGDAAASSGPPWVEVQLSSSGKRGWVSPEQVGRFRDLGSFLKQALVAPTPAWDGRLVRWAGSEVVTMRAQEEREGPVHRMDVTISEAMRIEGVLWLKVDVLRGDRCGGEVPFDEASQSVATGWARMFSPSGAQLFDWFPRGC